MVAQAATMGADQSAHPYLISPGFIVGVEGGLANVDWPTLHGANGGDGTGSGSDTLLSGYSCEREH